MTFGLCHVIVSPDIRYLRYRHANFASSKLVTQNHPNMKEKFIVVILCWIVSTMSAVAQTRVISARVISASDSIPVEFATVKLMQNDSVMVSATLTDENGFFSFDTPINRGMYLVISSIGCRNINVPLPCDSVIYCKI